MYGINDQMSSEELRYHYRSAEPLDGPTVASLASVASSHGIHLVFGMVEMAGAVLYDTAVLLHPGGEIKGFRKVHRGGSELHLFEARERKFGL